MPSFEELHPGSTVRAETAKHDYAALYQFGAEKGIAMANDTFSSDDTIAMFCKMLSSQSRNSRGSLPNLFAEWSKRMLAFQGLAQSSRLVALRAIKSSADSPHSLWWPGER
ncbi:hypothetical protein XI07_04720 [Bradyrhizobium sp. CCBAU 11445]|uniref:hypothetical protein n=1 Tax=unclassified Bradyrhizobium TaxID=2631580 RepID=UPI0023068AA4|nr:MULTISPECIES: hypothetical protein [unclassified Bradyrhizobium]MDA9481333.1 hypothetical protein [Bradyrhizobium sp. CCBAU 11445]MDA9521862.1 hypothetical protein [Bradyrhizobium sp. CCBAU 11434]